MRNLNVILFLLCSNLFAQSLTDGLLLHYGFDGDTDDLSVNGNDAVNFGATFIEDRFGNPNSAIYFDGVNDYINFPNISELKPDLPVSFSFWIKYESYNLNDREVFNTSFEEDRNTGVFFNSQASTGKYAINYGDGSYAYVSSTRRTYVSNSVIDVGNWHQIVIVVNSANDMEIYFDCIESGGTYSGSGGSLQYSDLPGCIGRHDRVLGSPANYFKGAMDDFRYWDRALTDENIAELLSSTLLSSISYSNPTVCGALDGSITISNLNFNTAYTVTYDYLGSGITLGMQSNDLGEVIISGLSEGTYETIFITDDVTHCSNSLGDVVLVAPELVASLSSTDPLGCDTNDGSITISGLIENTEYTVSYFDGSSQTVTLFSNSIGEIMLTGLSIGLYENILIEEVSTGCIDDLGQVRLTTQEFNAEITVTNPTDCGLNNGDITITGLAANTQYAITFENDSVESIIQMSDSTGELVIIGLDPGVYSDITIIETTTGCTDDLGSLELICSDTNLECFKTKLVFTPNNDGFNDYLEVPCVEGHPKNTFRVFNRYGVIVYESYDYLNNWDGKSNKGMFNTSKVLPVGTYFYTFSAISLDSEIAGWIYLTY